MKNNIRCRTLAVFSASAILSVMSLCAQDIKSQCRQAVTDFQNADPSLSTLIQNSAGYAIFPNVGKGGFIIGGAHGKGLLYEKGTVSGQTTMTQASIGAQAGGQNFAEIILFQNPTAVSNFKNGKFALGADVSAVVASQGAAQSAKFTQGVAVFTLPKSGLMVQASVGGQKFNYEPLITPTGP